MRLLMLVLALVACGRSEPKLGRTSSRSSRDGGASDARVKDGGANDAGAKDGGCGPEQITFYDDRAEWLVRLGNDSAWEDFESEPMGALVLPYVTRAGLRLEAAPPAGAEILSGRPIFPSQVVRARDFSTGLTIEVPAPFRALGFGYFSSDDGWQLDVDGRRMNLPSEMTVEFAGVIVECGRYSAFSLRGPAGPQGGIAFDDVQWQ
jgi:hypothetical protein